MVQARSRASALFVLLLLAGLSSAAGSRSAVARTQPGPEPGGDVAGERPNLLVVVTDDQRFDQLAAAGHPFLVTPTMDRLAAEGVRFSNAFVTTPICAASRASILTGRYEGTHGFTFGTPPIGPSFAADSYPAHLRRAGYRTGFVGKWGMRMAKEHREALFDSFRPLGLPYRKDDAAHLTERMADVAIEFLDGAEAEQPFCLSLSFWAPHAEDSNEDQYIPTEATSGMYEDVDVPEPPLAVEGFEALPAFLQQSLGRRRWTWRFDSREKQVRRTRDYWSMITGVDTALGRVLAALEERGLAENTVVVFTSDNGYFLGERGLAGKWLIYERSIRVPLLVVDPRAAQERRGVVRDEVVLNVDLAPTLLELAGLDVPAGYEGRSLRPLLDGERPSWRQEFLVEHRFAHQEIPVSRGVRGTRWVYALYDGQEPPYEQLFDLSNDPDQLQNLAGSPEHADVLEELRARFVELQSR